MREIRLSLRIVLYREDNAWIAHCLENDLLGVGDTKIDALVCLAEAIAIQLHESLEWKNLSNFFRPADGRIFEMFSRGKDVDKTIMEVTAERLRHDDGEVEDLVGREYADEYSDCGDLVPA